MTDQRSFTGGAISLLRALMKIAHYSPASTVQPVAIARETLIGAIGTWQQGALDSFDAAQAENDRGEPVAWQKIPQFGDTNKRRWTECGGEPDVQDFWREKDYAIRPLYAAPQPTTAAKGIDRDELIALLQDMASVNLPREAAERQARRMADALIAKGCFANAYASGKPSGWPASLPPEREVRKLIDDFIAPDLDTERAFATHRRSWMVQCLQALLTAYSVPSTEDHRRG